MLNSSLWRSSHTRYISHGRFNTRFVFARKKSLCAIAIVSASLFHYDGVWRVPYPIRLAIPASTERSLALLPPLPPLFSFSRSSHFVVPLASCRPLLRHFPSPSVFSFSFIRRPILVHVPSASSVWRIDGETRVHIFVTMTCVILRARANTYTREVHSCERKRKREKEKGRGRKGESEMTRECYEGKRNETNERRGGAKDGITGGKKMGSEGWTIGTRQGRDSQTVRNRFQDRCSLRSFGGWRTSYSTRASERQLSFGYARTWQTCKTKGERAIILFFDVCFLYLYVYIYFFIFTHRKYCMKNKC